MICEAGKFWVLCEGVMDYKIGEGEKDEMTSAEQGDCCVWKKLLIY